MKFSIIVPIYKIERFLPKCIDSVLSQSFTDYELILVDDGSPDRSPLICDDYSMRDSRVKVIHKKNGGLVSARKAGAQIAQGDYVLCLDGDDWWANNILEELSFLIDKYDIDVLCFGYICQSEREKFIQMMPIREGLFSSEEIKTEIVPILLRTEKGNIFPHSIWSKCVKRKLYVKEQLHVDSRIRMGEDFAVVLPIFLAARNMYVYNKCLYYYRINAESMTKKKAPISIDEFAFLYDYLKERLSEEDGEYNSYIAKNAIHAFFVALSSQFYSGDAYLKNRSKIKNCIKSEQINQYLRSSSYSRDIPYDICLFILKHRIILALWFFSKIRG